MNQRSPTRRPMLLAALAGLALAACDDAAETVDATAAATEEAASPATAEPGRFRSAAGPVPASPQRGDDPEAGYRALVNEPYVSCGIPFDAYRRVAGEPDLGDLLPGREGRNAELPYPVTAFTNEDGVEVVASNCLLCHAARFDDEVIVGLGNEFLDFTNDPRETVTASGSYVRGAAETEAWSRWADRVEGVAPYTQMRTIGVNPATNLTWALMAHRDPETMAWSDEPLIDPPPTEPLPVSVPPWWRMSKKTSMFYTTIGRGDHARFMSLASMMCADSVEAVEAVDEYFPDIRAWIASLEAPDYPYEIDAELADAGRRVFDAECSRCHGSYGEQPEYPNVLIPLETIGTDPAYARAATDGSRDRFYEWVARSPYAQDVETAPAPGYVAPPLDGVWATAPYLHNGAVPDMRSLLDSERRPRFWRHAEPRAFETETLGWRHDVLDAGQEAEDDSAERRRIYDTTLPGYGNDGHTFGDDLSEEERTAVIEYLKTL